jgi:hypothetical protein
MTVKKDNCCLLYSTRSDTQDIFFTFDPESDTYEAAKTALTPYFRPAKNVPFSRHIFGQERQAEGESNTQLVTGTEKCLLCVSCKELNSGLYFRKHYTVTGGGTLLEAYEEVRLPRAVGLTGSGDDQGG